MKNVDAIIIGTGQVGPPLAARFEEVCEKRPVVMNTQE
jgi:hypothetical protein